MNDIARQVSVCQKCILHHSRKNAFRHGPAEQKSSSSGRHLYFYENEKGLPIVGAAGKFLANCSPCCLSRDTVFITNDASAVRRATVTAAGRIVGLQRIFGQTNRRINPRSSSHWAILYGKKSCPMQNHDNHGQPHGFTTFNCPLYLQQPHCITQMAPSFNGRLYKLPEWVKQAREQRRSNRDTNSPSTAEKDMENRTIKPFLISGNISAQFTPERIFVRETKSL